MPIAHYCRQKNFTKEILDNLKNTVSRLLQLYSTLFDDTLKVKMHLLLHYVDMIKKLGPLKHISAIRGEAKHRELKKIANSTVNRINLKRTIAIRVQMALCARFFNKKKIERRF